MHKEKVYALIAENYSQSEIARQLGISRQRVNQILHPLKHQMRGRTAYNLRTGKLIKPNQCSKCNLQKRVEGHHADYNKEDVTWLCKRCHFNIHYPWLVK